MKALNCFALILIIFNCFSQAPQAFNYQGVARDEQGTEMSDQVISLRISIRNVSSTGPIEFQEAHTTKTNEFGLFNIQIGKGGPITSDLQSIDWSIGQKWLQIEMDIAGGTNYVDMGSSQLLSTPYALYAGNAGGATTLWTQSGDTLSYINGPIGIGTANPGQMLTVVDTIEITSGGLKFADGSVQATAMKSSTSASDTMWIAIDGLDIATAPFVGSVGIGTQTPATTLEVAANVGPSSAGILKLTDKGSNGGYLEFGDGGVNGPNYYSPLIEGHAIGNGDVSQGLIITGQTSEDDTDDYGMTFRVYGPDDDTLANASAYSFFNGSNTFSLLNIAANGKIGIGTTTPTHKLTVTDTVEITSGGLMFPDGSVQITATQKDESLWKTEQDNIFLKDPLNGIVVIGDQSVFDVDAIFEVKSTAASIHPSGGIESRVATFEHTVNHIYNPNTQGPHLKVSNKFLDNASGSSISLELTTVSDGLPFKSETSVELTNISRSKNAADFSVQCEYDGGSGANFREVARFTSEGNVGIGTMTPAHKLTVTDTVEITSGGLMFPDGSVQISAADSTYWERLDPEHIATSSQDYVRINTPLEEISENLDVRMGISSDGYLGTSGRVVGSPFWALHNTDYSYDPTERGPNIRIMNRADQSNTNSSIGIVFTTRDILTNNSPGGDVIINGVNSGPNSADFTIQCEYEGPTDVDYREVARFTSEGNVGIGTTTPTHKLTVTDTVEITSGGLMFPDGSVQTSAAKSDSSYWERLDGNTLGLATTDNVRINIPANSILDNSEVRFGVLSEAYLNGTHVYGIPFWALCNLDYQYNPSALGPNIRIMNRGIQSNGGSSMGMIISTHDSQTNGSTGGDVMINAVNAGRNAAHLTIQCEYEGPNAIDLREVARFTSEGNVGINNPDAKEKLHITDGNIYLDNAANGVIMTSPDGTCYLMQVANGGSPTFSPITCP